mgnify:CR=1 FL=1
MLSTAILPIAFGALGMLAALLVYANILKTPSGDGRVKEIADEIHLGAMVFMSAEYKRLAVFCLVCIVALFFSLGWQTSVSFLLGALCSGTAGFIGMYSATKANVRTAVAAKEKGASEALNIAFFGGSIINRGGQIILECGVRKGLSTSIFTYHSEKNNGHCFSVDIEDCSDVVISEHWSFIQSDDNMKIHWITKIGDKTDREKHWKERDRNVVFLSKDYFTMTWKHYKEKNGYKETFKMIGTQRLKWKY